MMMSMLMMLIMMTKIMMMITITAGKWMSPEGWEGLEKGAKVRKGVKSDTNQPTKGKDDDDEEEKIRIMLMVRFFFVREVLQAFYPGQYINSYKSTRIVVQ